MVDGVKGIDRAVLIRTSMGASRRSVKKRQVLSQSLVVHPSILSAARAGVGVVGPKHARPLQGEASHWHRRHLFQGKGCTGHTDALGVGLKFAVDESAAPGRGG